MIELHQKPSIASPMATNQRENIKIEGQHPLESTVVVSKAKMRNVPLSKVNIMDDFSDDREAIEIDGDDTPIPSPQTAKLKVNGEAEVVEASPSSEQEEFEVEFDEQDEVGSNDGLRYEYPESDNVEKVELYCPGGYHPVNLGDTLKSLQYQIIHKLGYGGFATVWLARDIKEERYVAIKIVRADASQNALDTEIKILNHLKERATSTPGAYFIDLPIEHFWINGPNGRHICIVFHVAGPSIAQLSQAQATLQKKLTLNLEEAPMAAFQLTQCLAFLHSPSVAVAHGDLTSSNVLLEILGFDHLTPSQVIQLLGHPMRELVVSNSDEPLGFSAPQFLYEPADIMRLLPRATGNIKLIDFGNAFFVNDPHKNIGTPNCFRAPEFLLENKFGKESDIWALACTIFEIRAGNPLFVPFLGGSEKEVLGLIRDALGNVPGGGADLAVGKEAEGATKEPQLRNMVYDIDNELARYGSADYHSEYCEMPWLESWLMYPVKVVYDWVKPWLFTFGERKVKGIEPAEAKQLYDLLRNMLQYDVNERLTADEVLRHPWLSLISITKDFKDANYEALSDEEVADEKSDDEDPDVESCLASS
jgi:serine/threonine-protein kinase SRPK3